MKLNTKSRYGVRALFDMAYHGGGRPIQLKDIARRQGISDGYLEQVFQMLKQAGLIKAQRGPRGGYLLARPPEQTTVADIVLATEGWLGFVDCLRPTGKRSEECCEMQGKCVAKMVWAGAAEVLMAYLSSVTIRDLCVNARQIGQESELATRYVFHI